jgi:oligopeptide/dipeptide ABC transporter ATP-binding protein
MYAGRIVECARAEELFARPRHPYTQGLLGSIPRMDTLRSAALTPIAGLPPDLSNLPPGCPFRPRCSKAFADCAAYPELKVLDAQAPEHTVRCFAAERGAT